MKVFILVLSLVLSQIAFSQVPGGWNPVDPLEVDSSPEIQKALRFGAHYIVEQGVQAGDLQDSDYDVTGIYSVQSQVVSGINYSFDVELTNDDGIIVRAQYFVYVAPGATTQEVTSFDYSVEGEGETTEGELGEFGFLPEEVYLAEEETLTLEEDENILTNDKESELVGGWTSVDPDEVNSDLDLQNALTFGVQQTTQQGIASGDLPDETYEEDIISIEEQVVAGMNYRFDVELSGNGGTYARVNFEVYSQPWTNTLELTSYNVVSRH